MDNTEETLVKYFATFSQTDTNDNCDDCGRDDRSDGVTADANYGICSDDSKVIGSSCDVADNGIFGSHGDIVDADPGVYINDGDDGTRGQGDDSDVGAGQISTTGFYWSKISMWICPFHKNHTFESTLKVNSKR